eukprot:CAMPEP_0194095892 /NCGR_PEP_ID=MMETSP0149-20130528/57063_1 /TAXON_ID=122233 /ORGANISM="Chaetoceros debilis, Strain MM31A-1" /LENGTH=350 /DNA_ID=CAMNT_0038781853 /DNA_START=91 /DNA_END=1139 /DNA_ORIENTATION=+
MKLYFYRGLKNEKVPDDVTHVIVDSNVTVIRKRAFLNCRHLVSVIMGDSVKRIESDAFDSCFHLVCVIMGNNVKRIKERAFSDCRALRFIRLSKTLGYIGECAFLRCESLEALFLPSTVKSIERWAFNGCRSMRLLILPHDFDLNKVDKGIIHDTGVYHIAEASGVAYEYDEIGYSYTNESKRRVNEWLIHHMDESPFHRYIGECAFLRCESLEALFLPSTVKSIGNYAFVWCGSLRLLILPHRIDLDNVKEIISYRTAICQIADNTGVTIEYDENNAIANDESNRRVNEWLFHHMDHAPFHKLCYNSSITTKHLNAYINEHGNDTALDIDTIHGMTPLHMLSMNPHSPA